MEKKKEMLEDLYVVRDVPIYYSTPFENVQGMLNGVDSDKLEEIYESIEPCTCGANPWVSQAESMGDFSITIFCDNPYCRRRIQRSTYDFDVQRGDGDEIELAIRDWNNGLSQEDVKAAQDKEYERIRIKPEDLEWKALYPNNVLQNTKHGIYSIAHTVREDGSLYASKWSIVYQMEEFEPMGSRFDAEVEAYILFHKRFFNLEEPLSYPEPSNCEMDEGYGVNDYGHFIRAYKTLDEAKEGAAARCMWQGINRDTIMR